VFVISRASGGIFLTGSVCRTIPSRVELGQRSPLDPLLYLWFDFFFSREMTSRFPDNVLLCSPLPPFLAASRSQVVSFVHDIFLLSAGSEVLSFRNSFSHALIASDLRSAPHNDCFCRDIQRWASQTSRPRSPQLGGSDRIYFFSKQICMSLTVVVHAPERSSLPPITIDAT